MTWTPDLVKELKKLWKKGLTTTEIGAALGMSKNAVVGKVHRLGLEGRPSPIKKESSKKVLLNSTSEPKISPKKAPDESIESFQDKECLTDGPSLEEEVQLEEPKEKVKGIDLVDLRPDTCRWPIGDPKDPDFCFCGKKCVSGKIYCKEHCDIAFSGVFKAR